MPTTQPVLPSPGDEISTFHGYRLVVCDVRAGEVTLCHSGDNEGHADPNADPYAIVAAGEWPAWSAMVAG